MGVLCGNLNHLAFRICVVNVPQLNRVRNNRQRTSQTHSRLLENNPARWPADWEVWSDCFLSIRGADFCGVAISAMPFDGRKLLGALGCCRNGSRCVPAIRICITSDPTQVALPRNNAVAFAFNPYAGADFGDSPRIFSSALGTD